jgi:hypothetical protein
MLAAALGYAAANLPVFPCAPCAKIPATRNGFHDATTNPETVKRFWRIADRNIGIPTGPVSGFWILDIDGADGEANLCVLQSKHGPLPPTRQVNTGAGRHLWFAYTGPIQSSAGRIAAGIDVRGDGAYAIVPPSVHPSGRSYSWSADSPEDMAAAPPWLVELARRRQAPISERALRTCGRGTAVHRARMARPRSTAKARISPRRFPAGPITPSTAPPSGFSSWLPAVNSSVIRSSNG